MYELDKLILDDIQKEWHKCAFESEHEHIYYMNSLNDINHINDQGINNMYEWNLLYGILNYSWWYTSRGLKY